MKTTIDYFKANRDFYGNPRYIVHFFNFLNEEEQDRINIEFSHSLQKEYDIALIKSRAIGGKKYRGKDFGGGIVFQSYNIQETLKKIKKIQQTNYFK